MNLNLIIDEEAFLGLMGNAGNITPQPGTITIPAGGTTYTLQQVLAPPPSLNNTQVPQDTTGTGMMGPACHAPSGHALESIRFNGRHPGSAFGL